MSPVDWYYAKNNQQQGPVGANELKQLAQTGQIRSDDLVWREGMAEWLPAGKVKGLFEEDKPPPATVAPEPPASSSSSSPAQPTPTPSAAGVTFEASATAFERSREGPPRHFFDSFLDSARAQFGLSFIEATGNVFARIGHYGLYAAMLVLLAFHSLQAYKTRDYYHLPIALALIVVLFVLQYVASRFSGALDKLNRATPIRMASTAFLDCSAPLLMMIGLVSLIGLTLYALVSAAYVHLLSAMSLFVICQFIGILALNPDSLQIAVAADAGAGDEAIGILSFVWKALLRSAPVLYGLGVVGGTCLMVAASWLTLAPPPTEAPDAAPSPVIDLPGGLNMPGLGSLALPGELSALAQGRRPEPAQSLATSGVAMIFLAASASLVIYLAFLMNYLLLDLLRALLVIPVKLDRLAQGKQESEEG